MCYRLTFEVPKLKRKRNRYQLELIAFEVSHFAVIFRARKGRAMTESHNWSGPLSQGYFLYPQYANLVASITTTVRNGRLLRPLDPTHSFHHPAPYSNYHITHNPPRPRNTRYRRTAPPPLRERCTKLQSPNHTWRDRFPSMDRRQVGDLVLPPGGLYPCVHHRIRGIREVERRI